MMRFFYVNAEDAICVTWGDKVLSYCERLMLASRRAKKRVFVLKRMRLRSDVAVWQQLVSSPSGKAMFFAHPLRSKA